MSTFTRFYRATVLRPRSEIVELHFFPITGNSHSALTSIGWFRERRKPDGLFVDLEDCRVVDRIEARRKQNPDYTPEFEDSPVYQHDSLWDFYVAIGYDRKTKRWSNVDVLTPQKLENK